MDIDCMKKYYYTEGKHMKRVLLKYCKPYRITYTVTTCQFYSFENYVNVQGIQEKWEKI